MSLLVIPLRFVGAIGRIEYPSVVSFSTVSTDMAEFWEILWRARLSGFRRGCRATVEVVADVGLTRRRKGRECFGRGRQWLVAEMKVESWRWTRGLSMDEKTEHERKDKREGEVRVQESSAA